MPSVRLAPTLAATALVLTAAVTLAAQTVPALSLGKPTAKSKYTLGRLVGMRELPDGRVVAADAKEGIFRLVDLVKGDVGVVGKQGDGADEYRSATKVLPLAGDSLLLYDGQGRKFLHLAPNGTVASILPFPATPSRMVNPTAGDARGAFYYQVVEPDTATKSIKTSLHRFLPGAASDEALTPLTMRRADQMRLQGSVPFVFRDFWGVREDGLVARVVSDTYQVIWSRDGKETGRTGPLPYTPIPITVAEQQAIRDSLAQLYKGGDGGRGSTFTSIGDAGSAKGMPVDVAMGGVAAGFAGGGGQRMVIMGGGSGGGSPVVISGGGGMPVTVGGATGGGSSTTVVTGDGRAGGAPMTAADSQRVKEAMANAAASMAKMADVPAENFPATKPALPSTGTTILMFDGNGMLWVPRERVRGDLILKYDIIAEGKGIVGQVKLPADTRLLGFGKGVVYLARAEEGSDWLERYALPKM